MTHQSRITPNSPVKNNLLPLRLLIALCITCAQLSGQTSEEGNQGRNLVGCVSGNCENGQGVFRTSAGNLYEGTFDRSKFQGTGKMTYREGHVYEGEFHAGKMHGKGKYLSVDGQSYVGSFENGKMHGEGELQYVSGNRYSGSFQNNLKSGKGTFWFNDSSRYEGTFAFDKMDGRGIWHYSNGDRYEGEFTKGKQNGHGAYFYKDGNRYEGGFLNGNFHGTGILTLKDESYYEGEFVADNLNGFGTFYYSSGDVYSGQFLNGAYEGCGTYLYANGDRYEGDYQNNLSHGTGTFYEASGQGTTYHYIKGDIVGEGVQLANLLMKVENKINVKPELFETKPVTPSTPVVKETATEAPPETKVNEIEKPAGQPVSSPTNTNTQVASTPMKEAMASIGNKPNPCPGCKGKGKIQQSEIRKNKMVTKDISNGLGPRNFVTYSVNEIVRPAGLVSCGRCAGSGSIRED